jgi:membrane fusion protein, multidrug efflux system
MARFRLFSTCLAATALLVACTKNPPAATVVAITEAAKGDAPRYGGGESVEAKKAERPSGEHVRSGESGSRAGGAGEKSAGRGSGPGAGGGRGGGGRSGGVPQAVEVINLQRRDLSDTLNVVGSLAPNENATIRPEMSGLIRSIDFQEGQRIKKGDLLLKLDDSELRAQLAQSQAKHQLAKLNLERTENLRQSQFTTQADVDRVRSEFDAAEAELMLLRVRLERTELRAPFDGITGSRRVSIGDYVIPSSVITTITDLSRLKVEFQVPERYIAQIRAGTKFALRSNVLDGERPVEGEVYFVNSVADRNTRSTEVKGYLDHPPAALKAGMFATIELVLDIRQGVLTAPEGAILVDQRGPQVVVVREQGGDKVAAFVPVRLGMRTRGLVEVVAVRGDLSEKDVIVGAGVGSLALFPGGRLEPRPLRAEFRLEN